METFIPFEPVDPKPNAAPVHWRWRVACLPHGEWSTWRSRSAELQPPTPTAEQIRESERIAYDELRSRTRTGDPSR